MKFKPGDIVRCRGEHFAEREILADKSNVHRYKTRFLEDDSVVYDDVAIIDDNYTLKTERKPLRNTKVVGKKA